MADLTGFDATKVEPNNFSPLPAGDYQMMVIASDMKATKDGKGKYLELKLQVVSGQFQNRTLFDRLNLVNANEQAVQIAKGTLSSICRAVNVLQPKDSSELHNKVLTATVKVKADADGNPRNEIGGYKPRHTQSVQQPVAKNMIEEAFETVPAKAPSPF